MCLSFLAALNILGGLKKKEKNNDIKAVKEKKKSDLDILIKCSLFFPLNFHCKNYAKDKLPISSWVQLIDQIIKEQKNTSVLIWFYLVGMQALPILVVHFQLVLQNYKCHSETCSSRVSHYESHIWHQNLLCFVCDKISKALRERN